MIALEQQLEDGVAKLLEVTKGMLPVELGVDYAASPGGLRAMSFKATIGGILDKERIFKFGDSAEKVVCAAIEEIAHKDIVREIRMKRFTALAEELGLEVQVKPKKKGGAS